MRPFLRSGDWLTLEKASGESCGLGDIVCFEEGDQRPVWRVVAIEGSELVLTTDNYPERARRLDRRCEVWRVVALRRRNRILHCRSRRWRWTALKVALKFFVSRWQWGRRAIALMRRFGDPP